MIAEARVGSKQTMAKLMQEPTYAICDRTRFNLSDYFRDKQHLLVPNDAVVRFFTENPSAHNQESSNLEFHRQENQQILLE